MLGSKRKVVPLSNSLTRFLNVARAGRASMKSRATFVSAAAQARTSGDLASSSQRYGSATVVPNYVSFTACVRAAGYLGEVDAAPDESDEATARMTPAYKTRSLESNDIERSFTSSPYFMVLTAPTIVPKPVARLHSMTQLRQNSAMRSAGNWETADATRFAAGGPATFRSGIVAAAGPGLRRPNVVNYTGSICRSLL